MDWNKELMGYKSRVDKGGYGDLIREAMTLGGQGKTLDEIKAIFDARYPAPKRVGLAEAPKRYARFEPAGAPFEADTYRQMDTVARLPVFIYGALMPDAHPGYAMPIGGVAALDNAIAPNMVGVDIGCRMTLSYFWADATERAAMEDAVVSIGRFGLWSMGSAETQTHPVMEHPLWSDNPLLRGLRDKAWEQLGTSGGGNHFIDIVEVQPAVAGGDWYTSNGRRLYGLMTHSGSRGTGAKVAKHYSDLAVEYCQSNGIDVPRDYAYLPMATAEGRAYFDAMKLMGEYSLACHELIHARFYLAAGSHVEQAANVQGVALNRWAERMTAVGGKRDIVRLQYLTNAHNLAWKEDLLAYGRRWDALIHRKGATPAKYAQYGIIPGSSGSYSYVVKGRGYLHSLDSASHGAGRPRSRTASKEMHDRDRFERAMCEFDVHYHGVAPDETVFAYKDIETVMGAQTALVDKVYRLKPVFVAMGGFSDDGD